MWQEQYTLGGPDGWHLLQGMLRQSCSPALGCAKAQVTPGCRWHEAHVPAKWFAGGWWQLAQLAVRPG